MGINLSVGHADGAYDNAWAEIINGLYKTEVIHRRAPWKSKLAVVLVTPKWVSRFNDQWMLRLVDDIPRAEAEGRRFR